MTLDTSNAIGTVTDLRTGAEWAVVEITRTSDGFLLGTGVLLDPDTGDAAEGDDGYPVTRSLFLGEG